jgi:hypothetical protein
MNAIQLAVADAFASHRRFSVLDFGHAHSVDKNFIFVYVAKTGGKSKWNAARILPEQ